MILISPTTPNTIKNLCYGRDIFENISNIVDEIFN